MCPNDKAREHSVERPALHALDPSRISCGTQNRGTEGVITSNADFKRGVDICALDCPYGTHLR